jgi:PAS domain-containing protein
MLSAMNIPDTGIIGRDLAAQAVQIFVELAPLPLLIADRSRVRYANVALAELFGYSVPELLHDATPLDLVGTAGREHAVGEIFGPGAGRAMQALQVECCRKDHTHFAARLSFWTVTFNREKLVAIAVQEAATPGARLGQWPASIAGSRAAG